MTFLRFFPYLKPHRLRLCVALVAMFIVGFLSTYNIIMVKPALDVLFGLVDYHDRVADVDEKIKSRVEKLEELREKGEDLVVAWKSLYYPVEQAFMQRVFGTSFYSADALENPEKLLEALRDDESPLTVHLRSNISEDALERIDAWQGGEESAEEIAEPVVENLNTILMGPNLYEGQHYRGVEASTETLRVLAERIGSGADPLAAYMRTRLSAETLQRLTARTEEEPMTPALQVSLLKEINAALMGDQPLPSRRFQDVPLSEETLRLLAERPDGGDLIRLNRMLLDEAYPEALESEPRMSLYLYAYENKTKCLRLIAAALICVTLLSGLFEFLFKYHMAYALFQTVIALKSDIFRNIMRQDMRYFTVKSVGFLMSRITSDVGALRTMFDVIIKNASLQLVRLFFFMTLLLVMNVRLTAYVFLGILPAIAMLAWFAKALKKITRKQKRRTDVLAAGMNESLSNVRLVKALSSEDEESRKFDDHNLKLFEYEIKRRMAKFGASPLMEFFGSVGVGAILLIGGYAVIRQDYMDASTFLVYLAVLVQFYTPIKKLSRVNVSWQTARVSGERISEMLDLQPTIVDPPEDREPVHLPKVERGLSVKNVTFAYGDEPVLRNLSCEFPAGKTTAVVGRSGSGKTTLANLLLRLYDPNDGRIELDGRDLRDFRVADLRTHFAIVTQETLLFNDTVAANITYGLPGPHDPEKIIEAARLANAHDFIMELDEGRAYRTVVGPQGSQLSGGQRQRLAIARAIYRDPEILILDEATSALDTESESAVQDALDRLMRGRTVVVIAHRLSTIIGADNILVLDRGRLAEQGRHAELLELGGHYANLHQRGELGAS